MTTEVRFGCNQETPNIIYSYQPDNEYLLLNYFDERERLNFTIHIVRKDQDIEIRLNFFSPFNGGSKWLNEAVYSLEDFITYVDEWYVPQDNDPKDMLTVYDLFKSQDHMIKLVDSVNYPLNEVAGVYNKAGNILRRVVLRLCRNAKFIGKNGKIHSNNYKPTPEGKVRQQRDLKTY